MPGTAPYQLWIDLAPIASAIGSNGTVTVTTTGSHGVTPGAYVQVAGLTGAGTAFNAVAAVASVTSGSAFTYVSGTASGTATVTSGALSIDLLNPRINYASGTAQSHAAMVFSDSISLSANGDGSGASMSFTVTQDVTPPSGPWYTLIPDNARVRFAETNTGATPGTADSRFLGIITGTESSLNESGQGSITDVSLGDVNILLDRLGTFGRQTAARSLKFGAATRASNVTTITVGSNNFVSGQQVRVTGLSGGGTASFNGIFTLTGRTSSTITYANTGTNSTSGSNTSGGFTTFTVSRIGRSNDRVRLTASSAPGSSTNYFNLSSGDTVYVRGIAGVNGSGWGNLALVGQLFNGTFSGPQVSVVNAYTIDIILPTPYTAAWGTFQTGAYLIGSAPQVSDPVVNGQTIVEIKAGQTETQSVVQVLTLVDAYKNRDGVLQRSFNTSGTALISGGTTFTNSQAVQFPATSLRSALDAVVEAYTGNDVKERRYYIDVNGNLVFSLVDAASKPTYATAPYKITTSAIGSPNGTASAATVNPYDLRLKYDHETTKTAIFTIPSTAGTSISQVISYDLCVGSDGSAAFTERVGAPYLDGFVEFPTAVASPGAQVNKAAAAWFTERHKPLLVGSFELRGGGTASFNRNGFSAGYAQTGTATFALVSGWRPGMWVDITSALGLSGLYRVEQVDVSFEPGSYVQRITVLFNRKNPTDVATLIAGLQR